jgi:uncharacterized protein (TIGR02300 family)
MTTITERSKALRGTKRACQACEVRFYDLGRDPIVCPACGAGYTPTARPATPSSPSAFTGKTGWRRGVKREEPVAAVPDDVPEAPEEAEELVDEPVAAVGPDEDIVLEPEADDTDVSDIVGHDDKDGKER